MKTSTLSHRALSETLERRVLLSGNPTVIDLLVLYTTQAKLDQGGDTAIQAEIQGVVDETNIAMQNSQIPVTIRLVHSQEITGYTGVDVQTDELRLQNPSDGYMDSAQPLRDQYGADLVNLVTTGSPDQGGFSQQMRTFTPDPTLGYSAIDETSLGPSNTTLAHEIGHNLGAAHVRGDPSAPPGPFDYAYGYRVQGTDGTFYDDIMSIPQSGDLSVPYYSNPSITIGGVPLGKPIGDPNEADLAAVFPQTAPIVAGYEPTKIPDTAPPTATIMQMNPSGQTLTFTLRYRDDSAVDASTIASNNVYVATPEGFNLGAELLSITGGIGNSFEKLATYRVTLPSASEPIASLHVWLRANQIKDINGNFAPAAALGWASDDPGNDIPSARDLGTPTPIVIVHDSIGNLDKLDVYQFTLSTSQTISAHLTGMTGSADASLYQDTNGNGILDSNEFIASSFNMGSADRVLANVLPAGTYYLRMTFTSPTPYTLTLNAYTDTTAPGATLDATDVKAPGASAAQFAVTYTDNQEVGGDSARYDAQLDIHVQLDNGFSFNTSLFPDSSLNTDAFPQNAPSYRVLYSYGAPAGGFTTNDNGLYTISTHQQVGSEPLVHDAAGNNLPSMMLGSFRVSIGTPDTTPPGAASVVAYPVTVPGPTTYTFNVTYHDNIAISTGTLDSSDILITGPNGFSHLATFVSVSGATIIGSNRVATYQIIAPGGAWDYLDDGTYTLTLQSAQVKDTAGNAAVSATIGTFIVHCPFPGDASNDDKTNALDFNALAKNFGSFGRGYAQGDFNFDGVVNTSDFTALASHFNQSLPASSQALSAPDLFGNIRIDGSQLAQGVIS